MQFRDLARQDQTLRTDIDQALLQVAADAHYIQGPQVRELEQALASYVGTTHCLTCANGTDDLQLALKVWGIGPGDAVFVPDFTFFSTAEVVATVGATPVFVDVDAATFNLSAASLQQAVEAVLAQGTLRPRVVIAVDLFGLPADYAAIRSVADAFGLYVLEDGAQGFGGRVGERRACSLGDISTTSFFPAKPLGCYGDGGAVFTDNAEWAALLASYRVHGHELPPRHPAGCRAQSQAAGLCPLRARPRQRRGCGLQPPAARQGAHTASARGLPVELGTVHRAHALRG